jgi:hypothetical protein
VLAASISGVNEPSGGLPASARINLISNLQATGANNASAFLITNWTALDVTTGSVYELSPARVLTSLTARNLALAPCALAAAKTYRFTLTAWFPDDQDLPTHWVESPPAVVSIDINTRASPAGGSLTVSPSSGVALTTDFAMRAEGWSSPYEGTTYTYAFAYVAGSGGADLAQGECAGGAAGLTTLSAAQASNVVNRTLPAGNHTLTVVVTEWPHGASPCDCTSLAIEVATVVVSAAVATAAVDAAADLIASDPSAAGAPPPRARPS